MKNSRLSHLFKLVFCTMTLSAFAQEQGKPERPNADELRILATSLQVLQDSLVTQVSRSELILAAVRGMIKEVDPSGGEFFNKQDWKEFREDYSYTSGSIGLELTEREGGLVIVSPIPGGPADMAGLRPNDVVRSIDGIAQTGKDLRKVVKLLRGDIGSSVELNVWRPSEETSYEVRLVRARVDFPSVVLTMATPDVAVLKITKIVESTLPSMAGKLVELSRMNSVKGLVLDLRRNSGGTVRESIGVAAMFLPDNAVIARSQSRNPENSLNYLAAPSFYTAKGASDPFRNVPANLRKLPLVVLVDEGTARGAEMIVAALKDNQRARIVGRKTFGRSSIQTVTPILDVAIKYTSAYWLTPYGVNIDKIGISPDRIANKVDGQAGLDEAIDELNKMF
jgi:carboxyl-terminal processing protease